jgi:peptidoglycan/LPS O-acetylase OafA/YrhL
MISGTMQKAVKPTNQPQAGIHLDFLDEIRGFAVLMVFAYHGLPYAYGTNKLGWDGWHRSFDYSWDFLLMIPLTLGPAGVAIFFVISGFCIHLSYARSTAQQLSSSDHGSSGWYQFAIRRFFRIYPAYVVALLLFWIGDIANGQLVTTSDIVRQLWTHLFLVHNLWEDTLYGTNPSFWSIAVEAQLYLIYPILYWISMRIGWKQTLVVALLCELLIRSAHFSESLNFPQYIRGGPFAYWFSWAIGAYLAESWLKGVALPFRRIPILLLVAGTGVAWLIKPLESYLFLFVSLATVSYISIRLGKISATPPVPTLKQKHPLLKFLGFMGAISYSLYLFHQPLISVQNKIICRVITEDIHALVYLFFILLSLIPITIFSWVSFNWLEKFGISLGKHWLIRLHTPKGKPEP